MQARESKKAVLFCLLILIFVLGMLHAGCKNKRYPNKETSKTCCCPVTDQGKPFPAYLRSDLMPIQKNRWDAIPENRRSEFSFNTRLYPFQEPLDPQTRTGIPGGEFRRDCMALSSQSIAGTPAVFFPMSKSKIIGSSQAGRVKDYLLK